MSAHTVIVRSEGNVAQIMSIPEAPVSDLAARSGQSLEEALVEFVSETHEAIAPEDVFPVDSERLPPRWSNPAWRMTESGFSFDRDALLDIVAGRINAARKEALTGRVEIDGVPFKCDPASVQVAARVAGRASEDDVSWRSGGKFYTIAAAAFPAKLALLEGYVSDVFAAQHSKEAALEGMTEDELLAVDAGGGWPSREVAT